MLADVAFGERAVDRVGKRVQADVSVGMAAERGGVGDANAAQPHMVAGREGVNVEALADPRFAQARREPRLGCFEILHGGHLDVGGVAFEHISRRARPFGDRHIVSKVADAGGGGAPMRSRMSGKRKACGVCTALKRGARRGREDMAVTSTCLTVSLIGVPGAAAPWRSAASIARAMRAGRGRPHRIVDEHDLRIRCRESLEPCHNALLTGRAAIAGGPIAAAALAFRCASASS